MSKRVFWCCLAVLLAGGATTVCAEGVQTEVLARTSSSWDGGRLPEYPKGIPEVTILRIRIPPGAALPMHKHPVINAGVLISGELRVTTEDGKVLSVRAGEAIVEVVDKPHFGKNESDGFAEIVVFYAGGAGAPLVVKQSE